MKGKNKGTKSPIELLLEFDTNLSAYHGRFEEAVSKPKRVNFENWILPGDSSENFLLKYPDQFQDDSNLLILTPFLSLLKHWMSQHVLWANILLWTDKSYVQFSGQDQHVLRVIQFPPFQKSVYFAHRLPAAFPDQYINKTFSLTYLLYPHKLPPEGKQKPPVVVSFQKDFDKVLYSNDSTFIDASAISNWFPPRWDNIEHNIEGLVLSNNFSDIRRFADSSDSMTLRKALGRLVPSFTEEQFYRFSRYLVWLSWSHPDLHYYYAFPSKLPDKEGIAGINFGTREPFDTGEFSLNSLVADAFGNQLELWVREYRAKVMATKEISSDVAHGLKNAWSPINSNIRELSRPLIEISQSNLPKVLSGGMGIEEDENFTRWYETNILTIGKYEIPLFRSLLNRLGIHLPVLKNLLQLGERAKLLGVFSQETLYRYDWI